jgi:hypothetical protein
MIDRAGNSVVTVKKADLLAVMRENLSKHRAIFEEALDGYMSEAVRHLEIMLAEAKARKRIRRSLELIEPKDQSRDYQRVIRMLEMSVDEEIRITEAEFAQYVLDDWNWKTQFTASVSNYMKNQ